MEEIRDSEQLVIAQAQLDSLLTIDLQSRGPHRLGFRGGGKSLPLYSNAKGSLYYASVFIERSDTTHRYWNAFGFYDGKADGQQRIVVEINIAVPHNRNIAGFFAKDSGTGDIFLMHDGKLGGGKKGVTRTAFLAHSQLKLVRMDNGRNGIVVAKLDGASIGTMIEKFAEHVDAFKGSVDQ